ncbi:MAG: hypothetical protein MZV64_64975 [Ignavibacteriales bacterium]|nr:hypothetical protein [Ignavibacteriales bacterium]
MDYTGNDSYLFYRGDGQDNITDESGNDAIYLLGGINRNDVTFRRDPNNSENMIIALNGTSDSINVNKWFRSSNFQIEMVKFSDGSYLTNNEINQIIQQVVSYSPNNTQIQSSSDINQQNITLVA